MTSAATSRVISAGGEIRREATGERAEFLHWFGVYLVGGDRELPEELVFSPSETSVDGLTFIPSCIPGQPQKEPEKSALSPSEVLPLLDQLVEGVIGPSDGDLEEVLVPGVSEVELIISAQASTPAGGAKVRPKKRSTRVRRKRGVSGLP